MTKILAIDPGHAGYTEYGVVDGGAIGPTGLQEKDVALSVANYLRDMVEANGWQTIMTRIDDDGPYDLTPRARMANDVGAALFVSIHCNAADSPEALGTEVWIAKQDTSSSKLAAIYIASELEGLGLVNRGVKQANFTVLTATDMPAVLVELAFISNPEEEQKLASPEFQKSLAAAIWRGVAEWEKAQ